jgi:hypothetical protein
MFKKEFIMSISKLFSRLFFTIIFIAFCQQAVAATYYVGKNGNDNSNGLSPGAAWLTISKANTELEPNDTVRIMQGEYSDTICPIKSGKPGEYITYTRYSNDKVTITNTRKGAVLTGKSHIIIDGIDFIKTSSHWIEMKSATYCTIRNCYFNTGGAYSGIYMSNGANYNKIINNTLVGSGNGPADLIWCFSSRYNLFDGNDFQNGTHNSIDIQQEVSDRFATYHIIRNNRFRNPYHTGLNIYRNADSNLVENNTIIDCGSSYDKCDGTACSEISMTSPYGTSHFGIQLGASNNIIRNNVLVNNGALALDAYGSNVASDNRIYNNTFYDNYKGIRSVPGSEVTDNVLKNNIFYKQKQYEFYMIMDSERDENSFINNTILGNLIRYFYSTGSVVDIQSQYPEWQRNLATDPQFISLTNRDFRIKSTSPLRNGGEHLTRTVSDGSGSLLTVEDARYFFDGFGIIEGDIIQLSGQTTTSRIISINYSTNQIQLDKNLSWAKNTGVSTAYKEASPDIGAFEYGGNDTITAPLDDDSGDNLAPPTLMIITSSL